MLTRPNLGGPTRQAIALWHALRERGARTLLVTGAVAAGEIELSPEQSGIERLELAAALAAGPEAEGWVALPTLGRRWSPLSDWRAGRQLTQLVRAMRPDVVHTHTSKAGWLGRRAAHRVGGSIVAHTFHGHVLQDYFPRPIAWWLRRLERRLARRTDLLFAVSASCADELAAVGVAPRERFTVVPPAVALPKPLPRNVARQRLGVPAEQVRIVCAGRLVPIKRVEDFLQTLAALPRAHGDIVGDGPQHARLAELAAAVAPGRVTLRGSRLSFAEELPAYDALVLPSIREGWPLVAVEAMAAGVPVVGYDVPGVRDALADTELGTLVPEAEGPEGLAAALALELADSAGRQSAGGKRFAPATVAATLLKAYRAAMRERAGQR